MSVSFPDTNDYATSERYLPTADDIAECNAIRDAEAEAEGLTDDESAEERKAYKPNATEIAEACLAIRAEWSPDDARLTTRRRVESSTSIRAKRRATQARKARKPVDRATLDNRAIDNALAASRAEVSRWNAEPSTDTPPDDSVAFWHRAEAIAEANGVDIDDYVSSLFDRADTLAIELRFHRESH